MVPKSSSLMMHWYLEVLLEDGHVSFEGGTITTFLEEYVVTMRFCGLFEPKNLPHLPKVKVEYEYGIYNIY
mgnify:FL=1